MSGTLLFDGSFGFSTVGQSVPTGTGMGFAYPIPNVPGTTMELLGRSDKLTSTSCCIVNVSNLAWKVGVAPNTTGLTIRIPDSPPRTQPADPASNVTTETVFGWTPLAAGIHLARFQGPQDGPTYLVLTAGSTTTIPDLSGVGLALPRGARFVWRVIAYGAERSIDASAAPSASAPGELFWPPAEGNQANTGYWGFTTAPRCSRSRHPSIRCANDRPGDRGARSP